MKAKKTDKGNIEKNRFGFFQIGMVAALAMALAAFEWTTWETEETLGLNMVEIFHLEDETIMPTKPSPPKQMQEVKLVDMSKPPEIIKTEPIKVKKKPIKTPFVFTTDSLLWEPEELDTLENLPLDTTVLFAEHMPYFKMFADEPSSVRQQLTEDEMTALLQRNVKYPKMSKDAGEQGTSYIQFTIDHQGNVTDVKVAKSSNYSRLDREAMRVVKKFPQYEPGKMGIRPVKVNRVIPIRFILH